MRGKFPIGFAGAAVGGDGPAWVAVGADALPRSIASHGRCMAVAVVLHGALPDAVVGCHSLIPFGADVAVRSLKMFGGVAIEAVVGVVL